MAKGTRKSLFKRWWFWVGAVVVIIIISSIANGGGSSTNNSVAASTSGTPNNTATKTTAPKATNTAKTYKVGQTATVDKFVVKVNSVKYQSKIDDGGTGTVTQSGGTWLIVNVTIKNNDTTSRTLDSSLFTVLKGNVKYSASDTVDMFINNNNDFFLTQVNPGLSATGNIAFNVPSQVAYQLEVDSGAFATSKVIFELQ